MSPIDDKKNAAYTKVSEVNDNHNSTPVFTLTRPAATRVPSNPYSMESSPPSTSHANENGKFPSPYKQNMKNSFDCDLEKGGLSVQRPEAGASKISLLKTKSCGAEQWPNRFVEQKKMKRERRRDRACCACWGAMSKKRRAVLLAVVFFVVVGAAIGVGIGVSERVGGGVVTKNGNNTPLPN